MMRRKTTIGLAVPIEVNGAAQCGGAAEKTKRLPQDANSKNIFARTMKKKVMKKKPKALITFAVSSARNKVIWQVSVTRIQTLGLCLT